MPQSARRRRAAVRTRPCGSTPRRRAAAGGGQMALKTAKIGSCPCLGGQRGRHVSAGTRVVWRALKWRAFRCSDCSVPPALQALYDRRSRHPGRRGYARPRDPDLTQAQTGARAKMPDSNSLLDLSRRGPSAPGAFGKHARPKAATQNRSDDQRFPTEDFWQPQPASDQAISKDRRGHQCARTPDRAIDR
ncbi:protein of unknown function [Paraburkholderia kururiensis]